MPDEIFGSLVRIGILVLLLCLIGAAIWLLLWGTGDIRRSRVPPAVPTVFPPTSRFTIEKHAGAVVYLITDTKTGKEYLCVGSGCAAIPL